MTISKVVSAKLPCPDVDTCGSSDAYHLYDDGHGYCFSCGKAFGLKENNIKYTYEYLPFRGIERNTLKFYDVKTKINEEGEPVAVGFKYPNGSYKIRNWGEKVFRSEPNPKTGELIGEAGLFGRDKFAAGSHKYVTITEGEIDALSLYQVLRSPVVSIQSAATAGRDCTNDFAWLNSFERVYLALDSDEPGLDAARNIAKLFDYNKVYVVKFSNRKDANEYLQHGEGDVLLNIWNNSRKYLPETVISSLGEFKEILAEPMKQGMDYPFPTLTEMTYGIRTGESVLFKAQEGVGKTEVMHAIEYKLLKETDYAIGAIFLEEPKRRHLQALAGIELNKPAHLPDSNLTDAEIYAALEKVVARDDRLHVYSHFGSDDPDVLLDTIRFLVCARGCRVIILDHITMAVSGLAGEDERRALDYISTRLEMMVKELDFALIFVSHVNDDGKTRGSRYIGKIADIIIYLERDLENNDPIERNTTHLTVQKNRFCGKTGSAGTVLFDPETYTYVNPFTFGDAPNAAANDNSSDDQSVAPNELAA